MLSDSNDDSSDEESGKRIFLTPFLPHSDAEKWGCIEDAYRPESLAKLFQSKANVDRITQFSRVLNYTSKSKSAGPDSLVGLKCMFGKLPGNKNYYSEDEFFNNLLPSIARWALELPHQIAEAEKNGTKMRFLRASQEQTQALRLPRTLCRSLLANMFLCTIQKPFWALHSYNSWNMKALLANPAPHEVAKLRMIVQYFDRNRALTTPLTGEVRMFRQRVRTEAAEWSKSTKPLLPIHVVPDMIGFEHPEYGHHCLHADFANKYIGGGTLSGGCVQEEIRFAICPELIVSQLLCQVMKLDEAIQIIGAEQFCSYEGYMWRLRYAGDFKDTSARESDGTVLNGISAIDALDGRGIPRFRALDTQLHLQLMLRELNKALAGFKPAHPSIAKGFPILATGNWGCGVFGGNADLKALLQWIAASEGGIKIRYFPFDEKNLGNRLKAISETFVAQKVTVGSLWAALLEISEEIRNRCIADIPLQKVMRDRGAFMQFVKEKVLKANTPSPTDSSTAASGAAGDAGGGDGGAGAAATSAAEATAGASAAASATSDL